MLKTFDMSTARLLKERTHSHQTPLNNPSERKGISMPSVPVLQNKLPVQKVEDEEPLQGKFTAQLKSAEEDELPLQGKFTAQLKSLEEEELPLQGKFARQLKSAEEDELPLQGKFTIQKKEPEEDELPVQGKFITSATVSTQEKTAQRIIPQKPTVQKKENKTGLPDNLKEGVENLSGIAMDDVSVKYNSAKPAQLNALAYAQGTDIHVAPGQEKHLPHEAWHVVQQKQGRVQPTIQMKEGVAVNDDKGLEHEADVMGAKAFQFTNNRPEAIARRKLQEMANNSQQVMKFGSGLNVIQARFDDQDLDKMREVAHGDPTLMNILNEVIAIHNKMPGDINYGVSSKGGHAALNQEGVGQVVVKDERWALTKKIKNYFNAYGMEHDVERQSMIIHELTHLAELYANLPSNNQGVVPVEHRPENDKALAKAMEPDTEIVDEIYNQSDEVYNLLDQSGYDDKMKTYLRGRLQYGFAINAENPTVFTEISYYLKAKGKNSTPFYERISGFANRFYRNRVERKRQLQDSSERSFSSHTLAPSSIE